MVNSRKPYWDLHDSTFIIFINQYEENWVGSTLHISFSDM